MNPSTKLWKTKLSKWAFAGVLSTAAVLGIAALPPHRDTLAKAPVAPPPDNKLDQLTRQVESLQKTVAEERELRAQIQAQLAQVRQSSSAAQEGLAAARLAQQEQTRVTTALEKQVELLEARLGKVEKGGSLTSAEARQQLQGAWKVVSIQGEGRGAEPEASEVVFSGKTMTVRYADGRPEQVVEYKLDAGETPREITFLGRAPLLGIYAVHAPASGEQTTLELCIDQGKALRPDSFEAAAGSRRSLWKLQRTQPAPAASP